MPVTGVIAWIGSSVPLFAITITNIFTSPYTFWFPIVALASTAAILVAILIAMLAPLIGRNGLVPWARIKAYEEIVTIILAIIFLTFSALLGNINPVSAFGSVGLAPSSCTGSGSVLINNLWGLATCNMFTFNQHLGNVATAVYWLSFVLSYTPAFKFNPVAGGVGVGFKDIGVAASPATVYLTPLFSLIFAEIIISVLQVVLLSSSAVLFSFLIGIGLIARAFGITRTFGNAMIALGIGIGFVYPLLVSITYGFINTTFSNILSALGISALNFVGYSLLIASVASIFSPSTLLSFGTGFVASVWNSVGLLVLLSSIIGVGIIFIPILNFIILDAFVMDFSRALGQQVSFMNMLSGLI